MLYSEKFSICMIIKNEEKYLARCLEAIKDYVDEIIIVDTGSTDSSKDIAKQYTHKVYDFKWCNDFSSARNFSISKATNDWILVLDADEIILEFDKDNVYRFIEKYKKEKTVGRIKVINLFEEDGEIKKNITYISRLFNKNIFCYEGIIHEQIIAKNKKHHQVKSIGINVEHFGYLDENMRSKNKFERNISLLKSEINKNPKDPYYHYQLGKTYYKVKRYKEALENFKEAISICDNFRCEYAEDLITSYGYALLKCEKYSEAMELVNYQQYYSQSSDYNFIIGLICMNNGRFQEAINEFKKCIGGTEGRIKGINSYQPNYNIGVIYETLGFQEKAMEFYYQCKEYLPAKQRIEYILQIEQAQIQQFIEEGQLSRAEVAIKESFHRQENIKLYSMYAVIKIIQEKFDEAEIILNDALKIDGQNIDIIYNLAYVYQLTNRKRLALKAYKEILHVAKDKKLRDEIIGQILILEGV